MTAQRVTDRQVMPDQRAARRARRRLAAIAGLVLLLGLLPAGTGLAAASVRPAASRRALCGTQRSSPAEIEHVVVVMLENQSYRDVIGSAYAPFQNRLARQCGVATAMFAATHYSADDYLAVSAGQYPPASTSGCNTVGPCATTADNLYHQLGRSGLTWRGYLERMRSPCQATAAGATGTSSAITRLSSIPTSGGMPAPPTTCPCHRWRSGPGPSGWPWRIRRCPRLAGCPLIALMTARARGPGQRRNWRPTSGFAPFRRRGRVAFLSRGQHACAGDLRRGQRR